MSAAALTRDAPLSVNGAIGFARELGISPSYAGFVAGGSSDMRDALRSAVTEGRAIAEDQVKSMKDVGMIMGAIRAGKLKADDPRIPDSVKKVIGKMKSNGIDPATGDPKLIKQYLNQNPKALEGARQAAKRDVAALPAAQLQTANDALEKARGATASASSAPAKASGQLNLGKPGA